MNMMVRQSDLQNNNLIQLLEVVDSVTSRGYLMRCDNSKVAPFGTDEALEKNLHQMSLFRLTRLVFAEGERPSEKLKSFFLAMSGLKQNPSVFFILQNRKVEITRTFSKKADTDGGAKFDFSLYIGAKPQGTDQSDWDDWGVGSVQEALDAAFCGTFPGSQTGDPLEPKVIKSIMRAAGGDGNVDIFCVTAQPSVKRDTDEQTVEIGLEHFIDVMRDSEYTAVLLAQPVAKEVVENRRRDLENLYSKLSLFQKVTVAFGTNESRTVGTNISKALGTSKSIGKSFTTTRSESQSVSSGGGSSSSSNSNGSSSGSSSSWNRTETIGTSESEGTTWNIGENVTDTSGSHEDTTHGSSATQTVEAQNKAVVDLMAKLDDALKRMDDAETYGMWESAAYFLSGTFRDASFAASTFKSLVIGDDSSGTRSHTIHWDRRNCDRECQKGLLNWILGGEHPMIIESNTRGFESVMPTNLVSGKDLPYLFRLPQKSVPGIAVETIAAFERSVARRGTAPDAKQPIRLGHICHMNQKELPLEIDLEDFTKHVFVTGSTGCGKSNTTELLLQRCIETDRLWKAQNKDDGHGGRRKLRFLVIEPAKGEYKKAFKNAVDSDDNSINIFTTDPLCERLLRINPFAFTKGIHVLEHVDRLLGIFSACWELTAAMPAILKKGVEQSYQRIGWDLANSYYVEAGEPRYPTFSDLVTTLREIIATSDYSAEAKGNYTGALVTRVESLTAGVLRQIFCSGMDLDGEELFDRNTIVDLSRLGSSETKALLMGVLVMQLTEWRQAKSVGTNLPLRHVTVIEEAHNLLRRQNGGNSELVKKSVESISNAIAEVRTYGEGFIIVDQSPGAVDVSAIKNTNTKIVMRLPDRNDCETAAGAMGLDEFQTAEIAKLPTAFAVVMQNSWTSAVLCWIGKSNPPQGQEELTDPDANREARARLALKCGEVGAARARWFKEIGNSVPSSGQAVPALPDTADIEAEVERLEHIGPMRKLELRETIAYCNKKWRADKQRNEIGNLVEFGMLAINLLGCWDCWRGVENQAELKAKLKKYLPVEMSNDMLLDLARCIRKAFGKRIVLFGGTNADKNAFIEAMRPKQPSINASTSN
ncbi:MAG: ATP-binding protein [Kiritimatiellae bacterium]|nr:ATP-binding protein [Kiritimatiellia bacterium]